MQQQSKEQAAIFKADAVAAKKISINLCSNFRENDCSLTTRKPNELSFAKKEKKALSTGDARLELPLFGFLYDLQHLRFILDARFFLLSCSSCREKHRFSLSKALSDVEPGAFGPSSMLL